MNSPTPLNRLPTVILLLITMLGIPGVAAWAWTEQVTQHPWIALGVALLYELLVLIGATLGQVWQKLQSRWVDRIVERVDGFFQGLDPDYRRRYLEHMVYRHRNFDVKGLTTQGVYTLDLNQVFVELSIAPRPVHEISTDPIPTLPQELRGQHPIWDYLRNPALQNLAVLGPPGSGKTTLLKHITLALALSQKVRSYFRAMGELPILLFLRDHAAKIVADPAYTLEQAISDNLKQKDGPLPPASWFTALLKAGRCLVLLDGLDEVADVATRKQVGQWVEKLMVAYGRCHFVITSRPHGYRTSPLEGVAVLEVRPFNQQQVQKFVHNWYLANELMAKGGRHDPGVTMEAKSGAEDLLKRLRSTPTLAELAVNPLLLTMIATVHRYRSSLPGRRVELYAEVCEVFLGKRQQSKGLSERLTPIQKQRVLQPLAFHLMEQERREIELEAAVAVVTEPLAAVAGTTTAAGVADFLKAIENESGLLIERESDQYSFAHLAFQEYLAAMHVREQRLEPVLVAQVNNPWWHETIRLYCAQADASPIVAACLASDPPPILALTLAIECMDEAKEVAPALRTQLETLISQGAEGDDE